MDTTTKLTISVSEAAEILGMSRAALYNAIKTGNHNLQVIEIGKRKFISRISLAKALGTETI
jgi:predicted DNA-binding protein YlxM (UPF0122 family)